MDLGNGLSLIPAFEVELTIYRKDVAPPAIDEWQLKETLVDLIKRNTKYVIADDRHLKVQKVPNLQKTRKEDPVAKGRLHVLAQNQDAEELSKTFEQKLKKLDFRIGGTKFYLQAHVLPGNSLSDLQQKWQSVFGEDVEGTNLITKPFLHPHILKQIFVLFKITTLEIQAIGQIHFAYLGFLQDGWLTPKSHPTHQLKFLILFSLT